MAQLRQVIEGMQILIKYCDPNSHEIAAEHDEIYFGDEGLEVTEEDKKRLDELGWRLGDVGWMRFV